jgi:hypothetical protein
MEARIDPEQASSVNLLFATKIDLQRVLSLFYTLDRHNPGKGDRAIAPTTVANILTQTFDQHGLIREC